jgi:hypothetical protein
MKECPEREAVETGINEILALTSITGKIHSNTLAPLHRQTSESKNRNLADGSCGVKLPRPGLRSASSENLQCILTDTLWNQEVMHQVHQCDRPRLAPLDLWRVKDPKMS